MVTSRAVAPLEKLAKWSLPLVHDHGRMLALKGSSAAEEIERDRASLTRMGAGKLEVVECGVGLLTFDSHHRRQSGPSASETGAVIEVFRLRVRQSRTLVPIDRIEHLVKDSAL